MSVNKDRPHVFVLPEDDANRQLANGFRLGVDFTKQRQIQVLLVAGGWNNVLSLFKSVHVVEMERYPTRFIVLLIDFDAQEDRLEFAKAFIPKHLTDRVFVLGAASEPEDLKAALGPYESIGLRLADECRVGTYTTSGWANDLLRHNATELARLRAHLHSILF